MTVSVLMNSLFYKDVDRDLIYIELSKIEGEIKIHLIKNLCHIDGYYLVKFEYFDEYMLRLYPSIGTKIYGIDVTDKDRMLKITGVDIDESD